MRKKDKSNHIQWPSWSDVYAHWAELKVPPVAISAFDPQKHPYDSPWIRRVDNAQLIGGLTNPQQTTAYHLVVLLRDRSDEFIAAYKLNAFCVENQCDAFRKAVLAPYFEANSDSAYDWWTPNARYVMPPAAESGATSLFEHREQGPRAALRIVEAAAAEWTAIAREFQILRMPNFMDPKSQEYENVQKYYRERAEERERAEYERLKKKFES